MAQVPVIINTKKQMKLQRYETLLMILATIKAGLLCQLTPATDLAPTMTVLSSVIMLRPMCLAPNASSEFLTVQDRDITSTKGLMAL
jgi:hypothetical protein